MSVGTTRTSGVAHEETKDGKRTQQPGVIDERRDN